MLTPRLPIVDLSLTLRAGVRGFGFDVSHTRTRDGWNGRQLHLYSHAGTHIDAPWHFEASDDTIDQIPLADCMGPAWVVELRTVQPREVLGIGHLADVENRVVSGDSLLLRTGWSRHADDAGYFRDQFPRIGCELAKWCVDRGIRMLGVEPPSVADVNNLAEVTEIHHILLAGGVRIVEGLVNLDALTGEQVFFVAVPLKLDGSDGSPVRAYAFDGWQDQSATE